MLGTSPGKHSPTPGPMVPPGEDNTTLALKADPGVLARPID
jgi:hypothetical protein